MSDEALQNTGECVLGVATSDLAIAREWFRTLGAGGLKGRWSMTRRQPRTAAVVVGFERRRRAGTSIGVYRTSLLPHERFGAGHPARRPRARGFIPAQDFTLAFEVVDATTPG